MKKNENRQLEQFLMLEESMEKLTVKQRDAVHWAIKNFEALKEMGRASRMTSEEIDCEMKRALEEENYATYILLYITKSMKESKENEEI